MRCRGQNMRSLGQNMRERTGIREAEHAWITLLANRVNNRSQNRRLAKSVWGCGSPVDCKGLIVARKK